MLHKNFSKRIGLALSSGMARGWAHIGAIRALLSLGFNFDVIAGCSMGALIGGCHIANKLDVVEEWARALTKRRIVGYLGAGFRSGGLISNDKIVEEMHKNIGNHLIDSFPVTYAAVTTDLVTGHEIWLREGSLIDAMSTSFALPGIFPPVFRDGRWLVDGALVNPLPVSVCRALGADMVIAVNLCADVIGKSRRPGSTISTAAGFDLLEMLESDSARSAPSFVDNLLRRVFDRDPHRPSLFGTMTSSLNIMQDRLTRARLAGDPPDVHIAPRVGHIGLLEFDRAEDAIREGEAAVLRNRPELADALNAIMG